MTRTNAWQGAATGAAAALAALSVLALLGRALAGAATVRRLRRSLFDLASSAHRMSPGRTDQRFQLVRAPRAARALTRELNGLLARMEEGVHARAHFAGNVAHEFRTPVATLLADVQLAQLNPPGPVEQQELLERMAAELRHLGQLIESFLIMTRIEAGEQRRDAVHVDDVVRRARLRCLRAADCKGVRIELHCPETTTDCDPIVTGDAELLQSLVENLVRNAVRHSPEGAPVAVGTSRHGDTVRLVVTDQGPGIPAAVKDRIFKRGEVASDLSAGEDGFGLGLSIVESVVRMHAGAVTLHDSEAGGCSFVVALPAARSNAC